MRLLVSSNVANGIYFCFELGITALLTHCINVTVRAWHAKRIYIDRTAMHLTPSRISFLTEHGATSRAIHRITTGITVAVIALLAIGGFSFVGLTGGKAEDVTVKYFITRSTGEKQTDFSEHWSVHPGKVSGSFLMYSNVLSCMSNFPSGLRVHSYFFTEEDKIWDENSYYDWHHWSVPRNLTCVSERNGFKEGPSFELSTLEQVHSRCVITGMRTMIANHTEGRNSTLKPLQTSALRFDRCENRIEEAWCAGVGNVTCAVRAFSRDGHEYLLEFVNCHISIAGGLICYISTSGLYAEGLLGTAALKSIAYLRTNPYLTEFSSIGLMLLPSITIEKNRTLRLIKSRDETEVEFLLLCLTAGIALLVTLTTAIVSIVMWIKFLLMSNLRGSNCFNSTAELLSAAADMALSNAPRKYRRENVAVGVWRDLPHVGPMLENLGTGGHKFLEEEL